MSTRSQVRSSQRNVLACTECVRRKIRCSKTVPCTACIRHNKSASCQREPVAVVSRRASARQRSVEVQETSAVIQRDSASPVVADDTIIVDSILSIPDPTASTAAYGPPPAQLLVPPIEAADPVLEEIIADGTYRALPSSAQTPDTRMTNEAAAALQFLAHGRRNVLDKFVGRPSATRVGPSFTYDDSSPEALWDIFFDIETARTLLMFHQTHLSWMHNAVHLPTFRQEFEGSVLRENCDSSYIALYYAILSHTLFHVDGTQIMSLLHTPIANIDLARVLFDKSIDTLFRGRFMEDHKLTSVQAICLLLQVAHNFDKSDLICILVSTAIRMSQCLNLHRLGSDKDLTQNNAQDIIDREVDKRVWWFLVRYDWFQIPFQNTCQVHSAQFNTPLPGETFDEPERMVKAGVLSLQPPDVVTPSAWANLLNQVSCVIYKHQEKMQHLEYPTDDTDKLAKVYDQVIWADREIKTLYSSWPAHMRETDELAATTEDEFPYRTLMPGLVLLSIAHKVLIVHRHFQLSCFRDSRFAFTQLSCTSVAERAIDAIQQWPDTAEARIIRRMWTTHTFVISCSVALVFALLFRSENILTFDFAKIRRLAEFSRDYIQAEEGTSSIARRGVRLLDALMELLEKRRSQESAGDIEADIGDAVRRVAAADGSYVDQQGAAEAHEIVFPFGQDLWASLMGYSAGGDFLDMDHHA